MTVDSETALEWFTGRLKDPSLCVRTGYEELDRLLAGTVPLASVTEIAGDVGAGKYKVGGWNYVIFTVGSADLAILACYGHHFGSSYLRVRFRCGGAELQFVHQ